MPLKYEETGKVRSVKGPVALLEGLDKCIYGQIVRFGYETLGMVVGFNEEVVQALILKEQEPIIPGSDVRATLEPFNVPVGKNFIGRVVNALCEPTDGEGDIVADDYYNIFRDAPAVMAREPVDEPLETGVKIVDSMIPIGKGQRELILGDKMTGKTTICTDAIINQKGKGVVCIYVCIGKSNSQLAKVVELFKEHETFGYTIIVQATAAAHSG
ncbi:MAG: F0F1 ATP synthase subunit alpha, partial [Candidatus Omnitrophica bacterium]|nr:F0F1 ATP synthase subunit alpha [Candidatus Omnitrophota bacterium]